MRYVRTSCSHVEILPFSLAGYGFAGRFAEMRFAQPIWLIISTHYEIRSLKTEYEWETNRDIRGTLHLKPLSAGI